MKAVVEKSAKHPSIDSVTKTLEPHIVIPRGTEQTIVVSRVTSSHITVEEGAKLTFILFAIEGWESKPTITFELQGRESAVQFLGFILGSEKSAYAFETVSKHVAPQTQAHYMLKAALWGHSTVDYKGTIIIEKSAQLTDTYLAHHTLLLSDFARARTVPALEIEADDVKAGHSASIGKMDEETMFYLNSRSIGSKEAEQMMITGFFESELQMVPDEKVRNVLREALFSRFLHLIS